MHEHVIREVEQAGTALGRHLRRARKRRFPEDSQDDFARRIGVSRPTYQKMEQGDRGVALGSYLRAAQLLGQLDAVIAAFEPAEPSIFERRAANRR